MGHELVPPENACRSRFDVAGLVTYLLVIPIPRQASYPVVIV